MINSLSWQAFFIMFHLWHCKVDGPSVPLPVSLPFQLLLGTMAAKIAETRAPPRTLRSRSGNKVHWFPNL